MKITSNVAALTAQRNLGRNDSVLEKSINKLSSGYRLNKASDDAAGMGIANKIRADVRSLVQASRNASQGTALVQVAEGAVGTISNILDRMKELATQAASDSVDSSGRGKIQSEFTELQAEITRIVTNTTYQKQKLLDGTYGTAVTSVGAAGLANTGVAAGTSAVTLSNAQKDTTYALTAVSAGGNVTFTLSTASMAGGGTVSQTLSAVAIGAGTVNFDKLGVKLALDTGFTAVANLTGTTIVTGSAVGGAFQVGTASTSDNQISLTLGNLTIANLGISGANLVNSLSSAKTTLDTLDTAIGVANGVIGTIGAASNRFDYAIQNLQSVIENMGAAESVIRDADIGQEMTTFTKAQILSQAGTAMLAQANAAPQSVLTLLRG